MKKLIALLLAATMCIGLFAGCGSNNDETKGNDPVVETKDDAGEVVGGDEALADPLHDWIINEDTSISGQVRFWIPFKGSQGMDDMIADFNKVYPNIEIVLNTYSNNADGNIALDTSIMAKECDVVASFEIYNLVRRMENGLYIDLTDKVKEEKIDLIANWGTDAYNYDGKVYTLPNGGLTQYIAINMTAWEEAGLGELPTAWTWDEYIAASKKMTKYNADGSTARWGGSNYQNLADQLYFMYQVYGGNRYYNADGTCSFDSDLVKEMLNKFIAAEKDGVFFPVATYRADNDKSWFTYTDGRCASTMIPNLARYIRDTETYPVDWITYFAPLPTVEAGQENKAAGVNPFSFTGITIGCQDEEAAWAFTKWWSTYGSKYLTIAGHQSNWKGTDSSELVSLIFGSEADAAKLIDVDSFKAVVGNTALPHSVDTQVKGYADMTSIWEEYVMYAYTGEMSVEDAMTEAARLGNKAIQDAQ